MSPRVDSHTTEEFTIRQASFRGESTNLMPWYLQLSIKTNYEKAHHYSQKIQNSWEHAQSKLQEQTMI